MTSQELRLKIDRCKKNLEILLQQNRQQKSFTSVGFAGIKRKKFNVYGYYLAMGVNSLHLLDWIKDLDDNNKTGGFNISGYKNGQCFSKSEIEMLIIHLQNLIED